MQNVVLDRCTPCKSKSGKNSLQTSKGLDTNKSYEYHLLMPQQILQASTQIAPIRACLNRSRISSINVRGAAVEYERFMVSVGFRGFGAAHQGLEVCRQRPSDALNTEIIQIYVTMQRRRWPVATCQVTRSNFTRCIKTISITAIMKNGLDTNLIMNII
jgi:hypothetical protein